MIPCKQNKCLVYAACLEKEIIYCKILLSYIEGRYRNLVTDDGESVHHAVWIGVNQTFPMLRRVFPGPKKYVKLDTLTIQSPFTREYLLRYREGVTP